MDRPPTKLRILVGPSLAEKRARVAAEYTRQRSGDLDGNLWLVPDAATLASVHETLLVANETGWLDPGVRTLAQFAEALISSDPAARQVLPRGESRRHISAAIDELTEAGELGLLGPIARRGGLVDAVEQSIAQAKAHGISSTDFAKWARPPQRTQKDRELSAIFQHYQQQLDVGQLADVGDRYASAEASLERNATLRWRLVVIDEFDRLAPDQWNFVRAVIHRANDAIVTLLGDESRADLFADPQRVLAMLRDEFPLVHIEFVSDSPHSLEPFLFAAGHPDDPTDEVEIELFKASTPLDEWRQVARRVKQWLASGDCRPDEVVIAAATLPADRDRATAVLSEYGIPAVVVPPPKASTSGTVRLLVDLLSLHDDDWPFDDALRVVGNRLLTALDGAAPAEAKIASQRAAAEWTLRDMQIAGQWPNIDRELSRRTACFVEDESNPTERQWRARAAGDALRPLSAALDALPDRATPGEWSLAMEQLASSVGLRLDEAGDAGWKIIKESLAWASLHVVQAETWTLREIIQQIRDFAQILPLPGVSDRTGRIRVVPLGMASRESCRRLVLVGMDEDAFSSREAAGRIYSSSDWQTIAGNRAEPVPRYSQQMLLFYRLVNLPSEALLCSYTALDSKAQLVPASPSLHELSRAAGGVLDAALVKSPSIAILSDEPSWSDREFRRWAVADAIQKRPTKLTALRHLPVGAHLLDSLEVVHNRSRGDSFGQFEGIVASEKVRRSLANSFGPDCIWSVSQVEAYAECPFKFLSRYVHKLEPLGDLMLATDHSRRGQLAHRALWELHRQLRELGRETPAQLSVDEFIEQYHAAVATVLPTMQHSLADQPLVNIEAAQVTSWSSNYQQQFTAYHERLAKNDFDETPLPRHLEWRFGPASRGAADEKEDPRSIDDPFVLTVEGEEIRFTGRIDRIDVGRVGSTIVFNVIDYKAARRMDVKVDDVRSGLKLQLPMYALAVAELLLGGESDARPIAAGYWTLRGKGFDDKSTLPMYLVEAAQVVAHGEWEDLASDVRKKVREIVTRVRNGEFPMQNADEDCTSRCDYSQICRVAQTRALGKVWPPPPEDETATKENAEAS